MNEWLLERLRLLRERARGTVWVVVGQHVEGADPEAAEHGNNCIWSKEAQGLFPVVTLAKVRAARDTDPWVHMCHIERENADFIAAAFNELPTLLAEIERLSLLVEEAREVVEPFARAANNIIAETEDETGIWDTALALPINAGDLRKAGAFLAKLNGEASCTTR